MTQIDPKVEKFIQETYPLMRDGDYDEVYNRAEDQYEFRTSDLTQTLWNCEIHPELEGLTKIPRGFAYGLDLKTFRVPQGIASIGNGAFLNCRSLTEVTIGRGVERIGERVFERCSSLAKVNISARVALIESYAFSDCTSLKSITLPSGVEIIQIDAFSDCTSLTSVTLPNSIESIGFRAFAGCTSLKEIIFEGTKEQWEAIDKDGYWKRSVRDLKVHCKDGEVKYR